MTMLDAYVYHADAEWTGRRSGRLRGEGMPVIEFSAPPEFAGEPGRWTPEHLLVGAVATCFTATFMAIADLHKLTFKNFQIKAFGRLEKVSGEGYRFTEITLVPEIHLEQSAVEIALKVLGKAEKNCFVAKSLRATIQVEPKFVPVDEEVAV